MFQTKVTEELETHILCSITGFAFENRAFYKILREKVLQIGADHRKQHGACVFHAGYLRLQTHTQIMY